MDSKAKAEKMERHLLKTQFPLECEDLPFDDLTDEEQIVVKKCMQHEDLDDDEFKLLKKTLQNYRNIINKHRPSETIEAFEKTKDLIETEQELLDILNDDKYKFLNVNLPLNGKFYNMTFEILPVDDSRVVDYMNMNIDLFKDYSEPEKQLFINAQNGQEITPEERKVVEKMTTELNAIAGQEKSKMIDGFLAAQLRLPKSSQNLEKRTEFWARFPFMAKWSIVQVVEDRLGLTEQSNEKLFQFN